MVIIEGSSYGIASVRHAWAREVWDMLLKEIFRLSKSIPDAFWEVNIYSIDGEFYHSMISRHC